MLPAPEQKSRFVERMFDRIAPRYDLMNRLMTLGIDRSWRRQAVAAAHISAGDRVLDVGCGTGDLCRAARAGGARAIGIDPAAGMLALAARDAAGCTYVRAVAERLPVADASCDAVVSGFALRNFTSVEAVLGECARVLVPGGRLVILEVDVPASSLLRAGFRAYFHGVVPLLGRLVSDGRAYSYLAGSLAFLPDEQRLARLLADAGFARIEKRRLSGGAAQIVCAIRSDGSA
jgi:demethylmenaquinone methyltransferase/2-methoxy-6-polyprenyl-1,4-benzoquinol methylase